ncbi:CHAT domain-containing protein [Candidatus Halobeggiatoa sp. HSG11]|nr:CHAT domain-containing protein [Candidatus Halobeggiatoa sp. HSG11]
MRLFFYYIIIYSNLAYAQIETTNNFDKLLKSGATNRNYGFYEKACQNLQQAKSFIKNNKAYQIRHLNEKADLSLIIPPQTISCVESTPCICQLYSDNKLIVEQLLQKAETIANELDDPLLLAQVFIRQGNMLTISTGIDFKPKIFESIPDLYEDALQKYEDSIKLAKQANAQYLIAKAKINIIKVYLLQDIENIVIFEDLKKSLSIISKLPASHDKSFGLLAIGKLATQAIQILKQKKAFKQQVELQNIAVSALQAAQKTAEETKDNIALSYAYGYLGELYYDAKRYSEALSLTRKALFLAQQADFLPDKMILPELVYRWYWQSGRLFKEMKQPEEAIEMYRLAIETLQPIRQSLANTGYCSNRQQLIGNFHNSLAPLYYELMNLLIQQHNKLPQPNNSQKYLKKLLFTLERFKIAEFQDYDESSCLEMLQTGKFTEKIAEFTNQTYSKTAILYPILLSQPQEQAQLLVILSNNLFLVPLEASRQEIENITHIFLGTLEFGTSDDYLEYAEPLYDWLIRPIEEKLKQIDTLVIVPDEILRTVPFAAFHDGKQFLIENYAIAVTQGLALTNPEPIDIKLQVLLSGISDGVQGLEPLPQAKSEIDEIEKEYYPDPKSKILFNSEFRRVQFEAEIKKNIYSIVHVASHGQFNEDPRENFFITYDNKITIDRLEELIKFNVPKVSVELLTLSACQTAVGSNRAALGLAGIAVKTGVKSALANLWDADDDTTPILMDEFYNQLKQHSSIAKALQQSQIKLLKQENYSHPNYWAPLVLVGNWM